MHSYFKQNIMFSFVSNLAYCPVRFKSLGCFSSHHTYNGKRKLKHRISTRMDPRDPLFQKPLISWGSYKLEAFEMVCSCVSKAKSMGYNIAAIENYGKFLKRAV